MGLAGQNPDTFDPDGVDPDGVGSDGVGSDGGVPDNGDDVPNTAAGKAVYGGKLSE